MWKQSTSSQRCPLTSTSMLRHGCPPPSTHQRNKMQSWNCLSRQTRMRRDFTQFWWHAFWVFFFWVWHPGIPNRFYLKQRLEQRPNSQLTAAYMHFPSKNMSGGFSQRNPLLHSKVITSCHCLVNLIIKYVLRSTMCHGKPTFIAWHTVSFNKEKKITKTPHTSKSQWHLQWSLNLKA